MALSVAGVGEHHAGPTSQSQPLCSDEESLLPYS